MNNQNQKGISSLLAIIIIIAVGVVIVGRVFAYQYLWAPEKEVEIEVPKAETPTDETANWETYRNEEYRFELKYPKEWTMKAYETGLIVFSAPDQGQVWISRDTDKKYQNISDYLNQWEYKDPNQSALWNVSQGSFIEINGINFYKYTWMHQAQGEVYLSVENGDLVKVTFRFDETTRPLNDFTSYPKFVESLSTFRFIE